MFSDKSEFLHEKPFGAALFVEISYEFLGFESLRSKESSGSGVPVSNTGEASVIVFGFGKSAEDIDHLVTDLLAAESFFNTDELKGRIAQGKIINHESDRIACLVFCNESGSVFKSLAAHFAEHSAVLEIVFVKSAVVEDLFISCIIVSASFLYADSVFILHL